MHVEEFLLPTDGLKARMEGGFQVAHSFFLIIIITITSNNNNNFSAFKCLCHRGTQKNLFWVFKAVCICSALSLACSHIKKSFVSFLHLFAVSQVQYHCADWIYISLHPQTHGLVVDLAVLGWAQSNGFLQSK